MDQWTRKTEKTKRRSPFALHGLLDSREHHFSLSSWPAAGESPSPWKAGGVLAAGDRTEKQEEAAQEGDILQLRH